MSKIIIRQNTVNVFSFIQIEKKTVSTSRKKNANQGDTFEVQVLGAVHILGDRLGVHFERVRVGGVTRDDHVVPLVVIKLVVTVPLEQAGSVPQVEDVVDEPGRGRGGRV